MYASNLCNEIGTCYQYKLVVLCTWRKSTSFVFSYDISKHPQNTAATRG